ncbi:MAG: biotin/lipoyl-binding protein [Anaerolineae bacterium]
MSRYQITIGDRTFHVRLLGDPRGDRVEVEVDGQSLVVDVRDLDRHDGRAGSAAPTPGSAPSPTEAAQAPGAGPPPAPRAAPTSRTVAAPLPGIVKSISVRPGQRVAPGDEMLVIEAMKMDNVIRAGREGVVDAVHVAEGHRVSHGQFIIEYRE